MKNVLIVGATGMIGNIVLRECLASSEVRSVTVLTRRSTGTKHSKLMEVIHDNYTDFTGCKPYFKDKEVAFYCIGVYTGQVKDAEFKRITVDCTKAFGDALAEASQGAVFCFLSGQGADQTEKSRVAFARYKGMAENHLLRKGFYRLHIFRPAYIYPVEKRREPNLGYRLFRTVYPILKHVFPKSAVTSEVLGKAMVKAALEGVTATILENEDIKKV